MKKIRGIRWLGSKNHRGCDASRKEEIGRAAEVQLESVSDGEREVEEDARQPDDARGVMIFL